MRAWMRKHRPSPAMVVALVALVFALGGTAGAAVIITSNSQVGPGTISGAFPPGGDTANLIAGSVGGTDLHAAGVKNAAMATGSVATSNIQNGAVTAKKIANGVISARAWGYVTGGGDLDSTNSHNVVSSTSVGNGDYCITLPDSINSGTAAFTASPDYDNDSTNTATNVFTLVEPAINPLPGCPSNSISVVAFSVSGGTIAFHAEPFFFVVG
jgi:hypothetical protein